MPVKYAKQREKEEKKTPTVNPPLIFRVFSRASFCFTGRLPGFEPQLLSDRLPVKICVFRADLIALNLREGSPRIGDSTPSGRGAVHQRTGVGAV